MGYKWGITNHLYTNWDDPPSRGWVGMDWGCDPTESESETIQVSRHPTKPQEVLGCPRRLVNG